MMVWGNKVPRKLPTRIPCQKNNIKLGIFQTKLLILLGSAY